MLQLAVSCTQGRAPRRYDRHEDQSDGQHRQAHSQLEVAGPGEIPSHPSADTWNGALLVSRHESPTEFRTLSLMATESTRVINGIVLRQVNVKVLPVVSVMQYARIT